jgi:hypothetical protein
MIYQTVVRVMAVLMVPATFSIGGVAYAAFRPVAPPIEPHLDLIAHLPPPREPQPIDLDKLQTLTTWSVFKHVTPPPPAPETEKTWTCEHRPVLAGRLGAEVRMAQAQTVALCQWR